MSVVAEMVEGEETAIGREGATSTTSTVEAEAGGVTAASAGGRRS